MADQLPEPIIIQRLRQFERRHLSKDDEELVYYIDALRTRSLSALAERDAEVARLQEIIQVRAGLTGLASAEDRMRRMAVIAAEILCDLPSPPIDGGAR